MQTVGVATERRVRGPAPAWVYGLTVLVSSCLVFWVQPLAVRGLLPVMGGAPLVWNTAMLFFQGTLLLGYLLAHLLSRRVAPAGRLCPRPVEVARHVEAGKALKGHLLDGVAIALQPSPHLCPERGTWRLRPQARSHQNALAQLSCPREPRRPAGVGRQRVGLVAVAHLAQPRVVQGWEAGTEHRDVRRSQAGTFAGSNCTIHR